MADPILHIKDGYYFEVPRFLWHPNYQTQDDVPAFLRQAHPEATVEDFNHAMAGRILIPQPFATLRNLHEKESGFAISKFMILELIVACVVGLVAVKMSRRSAGGVVPQGRFWNAIEAILLFMRNEVIRPVIGEHDTDRFLPLLWTIFFFILGCNLMGLIPWMGTPTAAFGVSLTLAGVVLATTLISSVRVFGPVGFFKNMVPHMDLPLWMLPLTIAITAVILVIEVIGLLIRHAILGVRLLANMVAGHLVLLGVMGLIATAATLGTGQWATVTSITLIGATLFTILELFVAFLQAYIFTFLSALFIGSAIHHH